MITRESRHTWLAVSLALCAATPVTCQACSCANPAIESMIAGNDNVFAALITGGSLDERDASSMPRLSFTFEVTEVFKGTIPFDHLTGHLGGSSCGKSLNVGYEYLVFAKDDGGFGLCSGLEIVSPPTEREERGIEQLRVLRAAKASDTSELYEPWMFQEADGVCTLYTRFAGGSTGGDASLRVIVRYAPTQHDVDNPAAEEYLAGFSEVSIWIPVSPEERPEALIVRAGDETFTAYFREHETDSGGFALLGDDVGAFVRALPEADQVTFTPTHTTNSPLASVARTSKLGTSAEDMLRCMRASD